MCLSSSFFWGVSNGLISVLSVSADRIWYILVAWGSRTAENKKGLGTLMLLQRICGTQAEAATGWWPLHWQGRGNSVCSSNILPFPGGCMRDGFLSHLTQYTDGTWHTLDAWEQVRTKTELGSLRQRQRTCSATGRHKREQKNMSS